jgi:acetyl-CoA C-acetyltransferase
MKNDPIVIVSAVRTPMAKFQGNFKNIPAPMLGAMAIKVAMERATLGPNDIDEAIMGCVLSAGLGQAPARQAALGVLLAGGGLSINTACTTINKMCGSGMRAVMIAHDMLLAGSANTVVAGGMESMTNAPYLLPGARAGYRMGDQTVIDHMFFDGLEDAYDKGRLMGAFAEDCAQSFGFTREAQDAFARNSVQKAQAAVQSGAFSAEITPVTMRTNVGDATFNEDEGVMTADVEKIIRLKPAFAPDGTVTAANAASIADGAAAMVLMRASDAERQGLVPLAKIVGHRTHAQEPELFTTAPVGAIKKLMECVGWTEQDVDLFEINEAFAVVVMAAMQSLALPAQKVNVNGGACILGHPIGASGARVLVTLIYALQRRNLHRGIAALCIGGGEAVAMAVELYSSSRAHA